MPRARTLGVDLDARAVRKLARLRAVDLSSYANFLDARSFSRSAVGRELSLFSPDLIVMNPPFSYRGQGRHEVSLDGQLWRLSPAAAFIARALSLWTPRQGLRAVIPEGIFLGEKHAAFWAALSLRFHVEKRSSLPSTTFVGVRAKSLVIEIRPRLNNLVALSNTDIPSVMRPRVSCTCVDVVRGRVPVHLVGIKNGEAPYLHTSSLRRGGPPATSMSSRLDLASFGELLLIPRVGNPSSFHPINVNGPVVLSDCLFGLRSLASGTAVKVHFLFRSRWDEICQLYSGTGASYTTVGRVSAFLQENGFNPRFVQASSLPGSFICSCGAAESPVTARILASGS